MLVDGPFMFYASKEQLSYLYSNLVKHAENAYSRMQKIYSFKRNFIPAEWIFSAIKNEIYENENPTSGITFTKNSPLQYYSVMLFCSCKSKNRETMQMKKYLFYLYELQYS